jgi:hypothetical protein
MSQTITVAVELPPAEAEAFAQFLKRTILADYQAKCPPHGQSDAELMQAAGERLRAAFAAQGFSPR